jgi:cytochrome c-type biogenesis protein CcmF
MTLKPERRFYRKSEEQPLTQVANWSNLQRDAYVTLAGWANQGKNVAIEVIINPLVIWLWIGGVVMTLGGVWCLVPRLLPAPVAKVAPTGVSEVAHTA